MRPLAEFTKQGLLARTELAASADETIDQDAERNEHQQCADRQTDQYANGIFDDELSRIAIDAVESPQSIGKRIDIVLGQLQDVLVRVVGGLPGQQVSGAILFNMTAQHETDRTIV